MGRIFTHIIGRIYLYLRYGKKSKEVVDYEYLGSYSMAGGKILLQTFTIIWLVLIGCMLLAIPIYCIKQLWKIIL